MKIGDTIRIKSTDQLAEVVDVYSKIQCCWVRFFEDYDETKADDECTFLFDEVEII